MTVTRLTPANDIRMVVAGEIRAWMGRRNVTQTALAAGIDMGQSQLSKRLNGAIPFDHLDVEVTDLLGAEPHRGGTYPILVAA